MNLCVTDIYQQASSRALIKVNEDKVASSWKDSYQAADRSISEYLSFQKGLLYRGGKKQ
jgi:hypothetical protein